MSASRLVFHTRLCDLLGIDYPILQSGMGGIAGPDLVATVTNAGGLGILAGFLLTADQLREAIHAIRRQTDKPFGVNLLLPPEVRPPMRAADLSDQIVQTVQTTLNPFRAHLGLPPKAEHPTQLPDLIPESFQVILEERVPVFSVGEQLNTLTTLGSPGAVAGAAMVSRACLLAAIGSLCQRVSKQLPVSPLPPFVKGG